MDETLPAVALLSEDADLSVHLREALHDLGVKIVYEARLTAFSRDDLLAAAADIVLVNLDDVADEDLDRLYEAVDGDHPRLMFNDADVTRGLAGWDKARWARHLAAKLLINGDVDPPRPADSRAIEPPVTASDGDTLFLSSLVDGMDDGMIDIPLLLEPSPVAGAGSVDTAVVHEALQHGDDDLVLSFGESALDLEDDSDMLAAELELLLATDHSETEPVGQDFGAGLVNDFVGKPIDFGDDAEMDVVDAAILSGASESDQATTSAFDLSSLTLAPISDSASMAAGERAGEVPATKFDSHQARASVPISPDWGLVEDHPPVDEPEGMPVASATSEGDAISSAEFIAPLTVADDELPTSPGLSLELVSLEETRAAKPDHHFASEMVLHAVSSGVRRLVVLGAAQGSASSVHRFLNALPANMSTAFLLVHHQDDQTVDLLASSLGEACKLQIRIATQGMVAAHGDLLLAPPGQQIALRRDGQISLQSDHAHYASGGAAIDAAFTMAANTFGADALAIVFAGHANDAVAGAQAINDRGGRIWVEESGEPGSAELIAGLREERITVTSGDVNALSARLIEEFS